MKKKKVASQWKVVNRIESRDLEHVLEDWTGRGWAVIHILGIPAGTFTLVLYRPLTL